jgi:antitoxin (DNA-binding transcriptional repressor) of toxin-antitoxin stability system
MDIVGIRELKAKLSHYIRLAKEGNTVLIMEHKVIVAELRSPSESFTTEKREANFLKEQSAKGRMTIGKTRPGLFAKKATKGIRREDYWNIYQDAKE